MLLARSGCQNVEPVASLGSIAPPATRAATATRRRSRAARRLREFLDGRPAGAADDGEDGPQGSR